MYYTEFLRVFRCLRAYAWVLAALLVFVGVVRIMVGGLPNLMADHMLMQERGTVQTTQTLADGTKIVRAVNAAKHKSVIVRTSPDGTTVQIVRDPGTRSHPERSSTQSFSGIFTMTEHHDLNSNTTTTMIKLGGIPVELLFGVALIGAMIIATTLAAPLTKENEGHLELAWTKPISRQAYALLVMGIDIAAILAAIVLGIIYQLIETALWRVPAISFTSNSSELVSFAILLPIAWYALLTTCAASFKRMLGVVIGMAWPVAVALMILAVISFGNAPVATLLNAIFRTIDTINPLAYAMQFGVQQHLTLLPPSATASITALAVITVASIATAVLQWRRVEA
ncbi:MAG: hypothetical protein M3Y21_02040 [Candidatus Eremiobacteraeota bacterium]|nr:hypothetical protein [Candidatus Eremiobacteraeota bacterium]